MNRIVTMVLRNFWIVPGAWIKLCRYAANPQKYSELEKYRHIQYILRRAVDGGNINLKVSGTENIPQDGGFMFYANHQGMFDVLAIAVTCDRPVGAVLKKELYNIPFIHQVALCTQSYAMDREDVRQSLTVIQQVTEEVKKGRAYLIFPEGTRNRKGEGMLPLKSGAFVVAQSAGADIVPCRVIYRGGRQRLFCTVTVAFGEPIPLESLGLGGEHAASKLRAAKAVLTERITRLYEENRQYW